MLSHWSAALLHGLPVLRPRLARPHVTVADDALRHRAGVTEHLFALADTEVTSVRGLLVTTLGRAVVDIAGATVLEEGVIAADAALAAGVPGPRRAARRIAEAVASRTPARSPQVSRACE